MTDTTTLLTRTPGDTFRFRGTEYVLIDFARTKAKIAPAADPGKVYTLARTATVEPTGHSGDALAAALQASAVAPPSLTPGARVRIVTTRRALAAGPRAPSRRTP